MSRRVLIVDHDASQLLLAATVLEIGGFEVLPAAHAEQALTLLDRALPDLILVDVSSPDMVGLSLARQLKADARFKAVPIVALVSAPAERVGESARQAGCAGSIAKPIDGRDFALQVTSYLPESAGAKRFLIVDDYAAHLELLRLQLEAAGHAVVCAGNGVEALAILTREHARIDGVVSDILMPQMDGYSLCQEIRRSSLYGGLPLVLYSGTHSGSEDRRLADEAGADAFIEKPAPIQAVLGGLGAAAQRKRPTSNGSDTARLQAPVLKQYSESLVRKLEQKSAELAQAEARLSGLVEAALDAIITVDEHGTTLLFNSAAEVMFGYSRAEVLGRPIDTFVPQRADGDGRQLLSLAAADLAAHLTGLRTLWGIRRDSSEFPLEASVSRLDTSQGRLYTVFLRDITDRYRAEQAKARSEAALRQAQQLAKLAHVVTGPNGALEEAASAWAGFLNLGAQDAPSTIRGWLKFVHPEDRDVLRQRAIDASRRPERTEAQYRLKRGDTWVHIHHVMDPLPAPTTSASSQVSWFHTLQDISDRKEATFRILRLNRVLSVLSAINALIVRTIDRDELLAEACRIVVDAGQFPKAWIGLVKGESRELRIVAGYGGSEAFYAGLENLLSGDILTGSSYASRAMREQQPVVVNDMSRERRTMPEALATGSRAVAVLPLIVNGKSAGVIAIHAEVAGFFDEEELKLLRELAADIAFAMTHLQKSEQIQYLANYDPITGLPNRGLFSERLSLALKERANDDTIMAVVLIDLERFRRINETLGRVVGDELLQLVGRRLRNANPSTARIGVDVFAVELGDKHSVADVARAFEDLSARCFGSPFALAGEELRLGCRGGIAVFPGDGADAETLLRNAEAALRRAKTTSEHSVFYAPDLNARAAEALTMESKLRRAIANEEFVLHFQPKVEVATRRVCSLEALIRWRDPEVGLVLPGRFIPVLEESGLIGQVGDWALRQALIHQRAWRESGLVAPRIAVNVSAMQLRQKDFAESIAVILAANRGAELELEITESMIMEQVDHSIAALRQIRAMGVSVAIDDFGTGYCSLSYLARLPVTTLKIDRTFVLGMTEGPDGLAIVSSIIALAHALKLKVVAEGVETEQQARLLRPLGCDEAQGYLFGKPVSHIEIEQLLRSDGHTLAATS
ncbi:MAG TPA: EAL domain-containing protein [Steroidobacteraceae bacterium]